MSPFIVSLGVIASLMISFTAWIILPAFNLHLINSSCALLKQTSQKILDHHRTTPLLALTELEAINIKGIKINKASIKEENDFLNYHLEFNFTNLFTNQFFRQESFENKELALDLLIDKA